MKPEWLSDYVLVLKEVAVIVDDHTQPECALIAQHRIQLKINP